MPGWTSARTAKRRTTADPLGAAAPCRRLATRQSARTAQYFLACPGGMQPLSFCSRPGGQSLRSLDIVLDPLDPLDPMVDVPPRLPDLSPLMLMFVVLLALLPAVLPLSAPLLLGEVAVLPDVRSAVFPSDIVPVLLPAMVPVPAAPPRLLVVLVAPLVAAIAPALLSWVVVEDEVWAIAPVAKKPAIRIEMSLLMGILSFAMPAS